MKKGKQTTVPYLKFVETVSVEEFENYYFNNSRKDTQKHFNIGSHVFDRFMHEHDIKKPKECIYNIRK